MVKQVITAFMALTLLWLCLMYPATIIDFLQLFINGTQKAAKALHNMNLGAK